MTQADPDQTRAVYEAQAAAYDAQRSRSLFEARWLARFAACLPEGGRVLDLGCGAGEPIARWFMAEGFTLTGVDFAGAMLDIARQRWPEGDWRQADMRSLDLGERFDGIIAWDSFFHLTEAEQRETLRRMAAHLAPGADPSYHRPTATMLLRELDLPCWGAERAFPFLGWNAHGRGALP